MCARALVRVCACVCVAYMCKCVCVLVQKGTSVKGKKTYIKKEREKKVETHHVPPPLKQS